MEYKVTTILTGFSLIFLVIFLIVGTLICIFTKFFTEKSHQNSAKIFPTSFLVSVWSVLVIFLSIALPLSSVWQIGAFSGIMSALGFFLILKKFLKFKKNRLWQASILMAVVLSPIWLIYLGII